MVKLETGKYTPISYLVVKVLVVCHLSSRWQCCLLSVNDFPLNRMIFFFLQSTIKLHSYLHHSLCKCFISSSGSGEKLRRAPVEVKASCLTWKVSSERQCKLHLWLLACCTCRINPWSVQTADFVERGREDTIPIVIPGTESLKAALMFSAIQYDLLWVFT